ncbi:MFS transporter [Catenulispora subtropica]|uniref:MFS transporter n=1 Tax=Catenulispora subtropica TaxID=450798 RepID=A0ABN2RCR5_9ACTN
MFAVVACSVFVANLDLFIVNVALPAMGGSFGGSTLGSLSWVLNAYAIVFAALLVAAGRFADRVGHKPVFLAGLAVFTLASVACAASPGVPALVAARVVQAAGAAMLMPTSLALLLATTPAERRAHAVRMWASIGGIAASLGPVAGGLLVEAGWRWVFLVNVPVGIAAVVAGVRVLPTGAGRERDRGALPDLLGAALLTAAVAVLALGLVKSGDWGWTDDRTLISLAAAVLAAVGFLIRSARHPAPIVTLPLFRIRAFSAASAGLTLFSIAFAAALLGAILWVQDVWGWSAVRTGFAVAPGPLVVPPIALRIGPVVARFGAGLVALAGSVAMAGGALWWAAALDVRSGYAAAFLPGWILIGVGVGLTVPVLTGAAAATVPPAQFATGSALTAMGRQIGSVLGVAVLVSVLGTPHGPRVAEAFRHGWYAVAIAAVLSAIGVLPLVRRRRG